MMPRSLIAALMLAAAPVLPGTAIAGDSPAQTIAAAAQAYLDTLDRAQLAAALLPFPATAVPAKAEFTRSGGGAGNRPAFNFTGERYGAAVWSNYPASDVLRPGLPLGEMTGAQRGAAMALLEAALSADGYAKVQQIVASDQALHEGGTNYASGTDAFVLGIFGTPSPDGDWMVQFGAHHLGLNLVIRGGEGTLTPTMTGAQPAQFTDADGNALRVLADENDKAFALLDSLTEAQRAKAVLDYEVRDLVYGPGATEAPLIPEGLQGSEMTTEQQALMMDLITEWAGIVTESWAASRLAQLQGDLDETWFAWSGPLTHDANRNGSSYYRIQGPHLIIEFSPQGVGGDPTNHVHTVYRDPTNAYGIRGGE